MKLIDMALEDTIKELELADEELEQAESAYRDAYENLHIAEKILFKAKSKAMFANNKHSRALELKNKITQINEGKLFND
jgi:hypothetical protein